MLLWSTLALAAPIPSTLSWVRLDGAASCIDAATLARAVETRLGRPVFVSPAEAQVLVEGRVEAVAASPVRWRAVLHLNDATGALLGERVVESRAEGCGELSDVVVVTLALMIDPVTADTTPPPPPAPESPPPPHLGVELLATGTVGAGQLPGVGLGGRLTVLVDPPGFVPLVAEGSLLPFGRSVSGTLDLSRVEGGLQLCPLDLTPERVRLNACIGVAAGTIFALDTREPVTPTEWVLVGAELTLRARWTVFGPVTLGGALRGAVPFRDTPFVGLDDIVVYEPPPVSGAVDLGFGVAF